MDDFEMLDENNRITRFNETILRGYLCKAVLGSCKEYYSGYHAKGVKRG